ncbi:hypothetical protein OROGR_029055 [Orobanche gracilis]
MKFSQATFFHGPAIIRRSQLYRQRPFSCFSRLSPSPAHKSMSSALPCTALSPCQAFRQTFYGPSKRNPHFSSQIHTHVQSTYQFIDFSECVDEPDEEIQLGLREILQRVEKAKDFASGDEAITFLDGSGVKPDKDFIFSVIWGLKEEWKLAFLVFKWGEKWDCVVEKTWCLMIWLLGNHKKFSTACTLIQELHRDSKETQQAMLIMIDRLQIVAHKSLSTKGVQPSGTSSCREF